MKLTRSAKIWKMPTVAWAEGIQAAIHAFKEITSPYWLNEKRLRDSKIALMGDKIVQAARARKPPWGPPPRCHGHKLRETQKTAKARRSDQRRKQFVGVPARVSA